MVQRCRYWSCAIVAAAAGSVVGCGGDPYKHTAAVTGTVLCEGEPAAGGTVVFTPLDAPDQTGRNPREPGLPSIGLVGEDGTFELTVEAIGSSGGGAGALVGPHEVTFLPPRTEKPKMEGLVLTLPPSAQETVRKKYEAMPVYPPLPCGTKISPATAEVVDGKNHFAFTLAEDPDKPKPNRRRKPSILSGPGPKTGSR